MSDEQSIIIKRINKCPHQRHGGAWKVAFADFMTAAMAFFLMLWILSSSSDTEMRFMAEYFRDPSVIQGSPHALIESERSGQPTDAVIDMGGFMDTPKGHDEQQIEERRQQERDEMLETKRELEQLIESSPVLQEFKDQIRIDITPNGLRVEILDDRGRSMFGTGVDAPRDFAIGIIREVGRVMAKTGRPISITGHTDSSGYAPDAEYTNWELSADRANAARRIMLSAGVNPDKVAQVVGLADTVLFDKENPYNPRNRRISVVLMNQDAMERIRSLSEAEAEL